MKIALAGNQNSGKTTLFNLLTGINQKVGNWPGVTIERKEGRIKGTNLTIVDLPGIYSLSPYTGEEEVTRKYVMEEKPDLIINIVDATNLERSLYLTTQLLELNSKVIIALNMCDVLEKKGIEINVDELSSLLHTTIVKISALKNLGIDELIAHVNEKSGLENIHQEIFNKDVEDLVATVISKYQCSRFEAVKIIENDLGYAKKDEEILSAINKLQQHYGVDTEEIIASQRYDYIVEVTNKSVKKENLKESITDKLDKVFLHKWLSIPIFVGIMALIYILSVGVVGGATVDFISNTVTNISESFSDILSNWGTSPWLVSLVCDGIIAGVGAVLNFVPQLIILFLLISILETTGYMSRIAFVLDRLFRKFGLNGKSLIPFIVGSGCTVPGIMTARTIEDETEKRITIMTTPFIPCSAKLPIISLFTGMFFPNHKGLVTISFYFLSIVVILISSLIMKKLFKKKEEGAFISELPEYKLPSVKYVLRDAGEKIVEFITRAGTIILLCSIVTWFLVSFSWDFWNGMVESVDESILASIGNMFAWIFYPMLGEYSWAATVSAVQGLIAKEAVVSSMNVIAGLAEDSQDVIALFNSSVFNFFNGASAYAYSVFCLFSAPCFGAISAMRKELGSAKKMWQAVLFQTGLAWVLAVAIYLIGSLILSVI